jgi:peroxiredoxin
MSIAIGTVAPLFTLPDTQGADHSLNPQESAATVVVFTANRCSYSLAWHGRIETVGREYADRGVRLLQINSNVPELSPHDADAVRAYRVSLGQFAGPYLTDATQEVARSFDAAVTPDVFVIDKSGKVAYHGAPDADRDDESLNAQWLRDALDDVLSGEPVRTPETEAVGCALKYRT